MAPPAAVDDPGRSSSVVRWTQIRRRAPACDSHRGESPRRPRAQRPQHAQLSECILRPAERSEVRTAGVSPAARGCRETRNATGRPGCAGLGCDVKRVMCVWAVSRVFIVAASLRRLVHIIRSIIIVLQSLKARVNMRDSRRYADPTPYTPSNLQI